MGTGRKERPGRDADPSPPSSAVVKKEQSYTSTPPMGRTAYTEPQCLYKVNFTLQWFIRVCFTRLINERSNFCKFAD